VYSSNYCISAVRLCKESNQLRFNERTVLVFNYEQLKIIYKLYKREENTGYTKLTYLLNNYQQTALGVGRHRLYTRG